MSEPTNAASILTSAIPRRSSGFGDFVAGTRVDVLSDDAAIRSYAYISFDRSVAPIYGEESAFLFDRAPSLTTALHYSGAVVADTAAARVVNNDSVHGGHAETGRLEFQTSDAADNSKPTLTGLILPTTIDVTRGDAQSTIGARASDVGLGVDYVYVSLDKSFQTPSGRSSSIVLYDSRDSFSDGVSSYVQSFSSNSAAGTYNVTSVIVYDKAGNSSVYFDNDLASLGIQTSFEIKSTVVADATKPMLGGLILPSTIDVTSGDAQATIGARASDVGLGVDYVYVSLDKSFQTPSGRSSSIVLYDSRDSFSDGVSSYVQSFSRNSAAGTYNVTSVIVYDKAGNSSVYFDNDLAGLGIQSSFVIADRNLAPTAYVTAPLNIIEGTTATVPLTLTLTNVTSATTNVTMSFASAQSTATNGVDVAVGNFSGSYSISQSPAGTYTITLPSISVFDDLIAEGTETVAVRIRASGQIFDSGSDETIVTISLIDNETYRGTSGNDSVRGGAGNDAITPLGGRDTIDGGGGNDTVILAGIRGSYAVTNVSGQLYLLHGPDGVRLTNVENVRFDDGSVTTTTLAADAAPFDPLRYLASNSDLIRGFGADTVAATVHYVTNGFTEGRSALAFDAYTYLASNSDLLAGFGSNALAAERHYVTNGYAEGRAVASFDALRYIASNQDLIAGFGANSAAGAQHYVTYGHAESRPVDSFDPYHYLASNVDLARQYGANATAAETHYIEHGLAEGRSTTSFDALRYLASNLDLARGYGVDVAAAELHYIQSGIAEGRSATSFDPLQYLASNTDLARGFGYDVQGAETHYLLHGVAEGRAAAGFDPIAYLLTYPDLAMAKLNTVQATEHWVVNGADEGRVGDSLFGHEQSNHVATVGTVVRDAFESGSDHDWFSLTVAEGQRVTVALHGIGLSPGLTVADEHGNTIASAIGPNGDAVIDFTADHAASYYLTAYSSTGVAGSYAVDAHFF